MKNLKKAELAVIALTLLCLFFTAGYFVGRGASVHVISFDTRAQASEPAPAAAAEQEPADGPVTSGTAADAVSSDAAVTVPLPEAAGSTGSAATEPVTGTTLAGTAQSQKININTAPLAKLDELSGIGPVLAQSIIDYREKSGGFSSIEQIMEVDGIGEKKFAAMKDMITVG
jgi:competence protein ComEA